MSWPKLFLVHVQLEIPFALAVLCTLETFGIRARQTQRNTPLRLLAPSMVLLSCQRTLYDRSAWFTARRFSTSGHPFELNLTGLLFRHPPYMLWEPPHAPCTLVKPEFLRPLDSYGQLSLQLSDHFFSLPSARSLDLVLGNYRDRAEPLMSECEPCSLVAYIAP